jgi:hypothetical protein
MAPLMTRDRRFCERLQGTGGLPHVYLRLFEMVLAVGLSTFVGLWGLGTLLFNGFIYEEGAMHDVYPYSRALRRPPGVGSLYLRKGMMGNE